MVPWLHNIHQKYGDVVRVKPNECSFISAETAWQDIYGFRTGRNKGGETYQKDLNWYPPAVDGKRSMLSADDANHSRMRKNLSHAFSDRELRGQEPIVQDLIVSTYISGQEVHGFFPACLLSARPTHAHCLNHH